MEDNYIVNVKDKKITSLGLPKTKHKVELNNEYKVNVKGSNMLELKEGETVVVSKIARDPGRYNIHLTYTEQDKEDFVAVAGAFDKAIAQSYVERVN